VSATDVFTADSLIEAFGDQAYHKGLRMVVEALMAGERESCRALSVATRELMMRGYHKYPEAKPK
jgi:hypothetical protein